MAIEEIKMYTVICDNCKADLCENQEFSCWNTESYVLEVAMEDDWIEDEGNNYCSDCWKYNDDDEIVINTERKNKYAIP